MSASAQRDVEQVEQWRREGKTLVPHKGRPTYPGGAHALHDAEAEADVAGLKGALRLLYIRERGEGWLAGEQLISTTEAGLLDWLSKPLAAFALTPFLGRKSAESAAGAVEAPGAGKSKLKRDPETGRGSIEASPGIGEQTADITGNVLSGITGAIGQLISTYGVRLLEIIAGAVLVLFGLATLAKGSPPKVPVPVAL